MRSTDTSLHRESVNYSEIVIIILEPSHLKLDITNLISTIDVVT